MKKIKWIIGTLILIVTLQQIITYTVPVRVGSFPEHYSYEIINPYKGHKIIDDSEIEKLISYLEKNKFTRIPDPSYTYNSEKTISIDFNAKSEPFVPIHLYFLVYDPDRSYMQFGSNRYKFDNDDIEFLNQFFGVQIQ